MGSASPDTAAPWHALDVATSARRLATDLESGLTQAEAERRLTSLGRNELEVAEGPSRLRILLSQFNDVLIWLLIGAAVVSGAFLSEWVDTGVIVAIVVLNAVLGYVQESRAEEALAALKELTAPQAMTRNQYQFADTMTGVLVYIVVPNLVVVRRDRYRLVHPLDPHRYLLKLLLDALTGVEHRVHGQAGCAEDLSSTRRLGAARRATTDACVIRPRAQRWARGEQAVVNCAGVHGSLV